MRVYFLFSIVLLLMACNGASNNSSGNLNASNKNAAANQANQAKTTFAVPVYGYEIVKAYPHDPNAFTQGLIVHNGVFYEGTGGRKKEEKFYSSLRKVEIATGRVLQKHDLPDPYFGEGITLFNGKIYQLTWQENTAFVYDANDFKLLKEIKYNGEGWGLTHDGTNLIMTDRTHVIRFVNPETFETVRTIVVNDENGRPLMAINELEYVKGEIWANVWQKDYIVRIDPNTGKILGRIDFEKLVDEQFDKNDDADVLNGIAYDEAGDRIFVTGKLWNSVYEIKIQPKQ